MPPPLPLTAAPLPDLDWSRSNTPAARSFDDIYFSTDGGLEETQSVFLKGCGLPERWRDGQDHSIGELGFGSGLNCLAAWQAFERAAQSGQHLHFISVEKFPFTQDMLRKALIHWPALKEKAARLTALWPGPVKGLHRLHLAHNVTLSLYIDDVSAALPHMSAPIDSWFLDGFSPLKNPAMWSGDVMQSLARLCHSETRLATFTVAGHVRAALSSAGFTVSKETGFGRKRHRLEARFEHGPKRAQRAAPSPLIIGGGIAGASLARAAQRAHLCARLIHSPHHLQRAASANPAALIKPRLDLQDRPESRFFLSAYLYALRAYQDKGEIISAGITQIAKDDKERARFEKLLTHAPLPKAHMKTHKSGISFARALVIDPVKTTQSWRDGCAAQSANITHIKQRDGQWAAIGAAGQIIDQSEYMILACGAGVREIGFEDKGTIASLLSLRFSRGQLSWAHGDIGGPTAYGGYAVPLGGNILLGATHERINSDTPYDARLEDDEKNLAGAQQFLGESLSLSGQIGRASLRVTTANTLPRLIQLAPKLWIMTGLGSRGFVFAPLLADHLISQLIGGPNSVTKAALA